MKYFQDFCKIYSLPFFECKGYRYGLCRECMKLDSVAVYKCDICGFEIDYPDEEKVEDGEKHFYVNCLKKEDTGGRNNESSGAL